jgi:capsular exopolysaccharide synthesis family protein
MSTPDRPPNSILVTSALPSEGKSTVSRGLAAMLAMHNSRVLLIDADLHRPAQSNALKLQPLRGLSDILTSSIDPSEIILPIAEVPGLFLLPSGRCPPQPATLLSSDKMRQIIAQLKSEYDFVVIDSPPVLRVSDTVLCGPMVEAVVLIVRENLADIHAIRQTINLIRRGGGNVIGFAMNATTGRGSGYDSYYRKYGYYGTKETSGSKA